MSEEHAQVAVQPVERALNLIPVGLKEAALDSPTFRATTFHFAEQIEAVERWLDGYAKAAVRLVAEVSSLETAVNSFLAQSLPATQISEAVLDHDYAMLAMQRYNEGAKEFWQNTLRGAKRYDSVVVEPIRHFLNNELKSFKDARRVLDTAQRSFDSIISRYLGQSKGKEASSLREDAFQLHEARKAYLKASFDYCISAPVLRAALDKLVVRIFSEQWKDMRSPKDTNATTFAKCNNEMERVKGWSREMENSERAFKRELVAARSQIEGRVELMTRPSRELEDYAASTVPYLGTGASGVTSKPKSGQEKSERQGWLFLKTITGKPTRTVWSRRWFFVKHGIFGWLIQGSRSGGVEESEKTGVLLCGVRPTFQEDRRFCFEVKTKDTSVILQAETQQELTEWISAFEVAKRKALDDPASTESGPQVSGIDPAFAISPPVAPEFAAKVGDAHVPQGGEEGGLGAPDGPGITNKPTFDVAAVGRRVTSVEKDSEGTREHAARIIQKLDLHKRSTTLPQSTQGPASGGIASLISASHNVLPVGPGAPAPGSEGPKRNITIPASSLAPSTLANPPASTNLSHTAVAISGERGISLGRADGSGMPSGILANLWGSNNWGYVNRIGDEAKSPIPLSSPPSPRTRASSVSQDDSIVRDGLTEASKQLGFLTPEPGPSPVHRKTVSIGNSPHAAGARAADESEADVYPNYYPLALKAQNTQFRMLFPHVTKAEKLVLVFRATWNPNEQQEFPGRVYVTEKEVYFYSNHLGLVLITGVSLSTINDVTAAPGRDCDFVFLHLKEPNRQDETRRITVKIFLEQLRLLQRRLNYLVQNANADEPESLQEVIKALIKMEFEEPKRSMSIESWEDIRLDGEEAMSGDQTSPRRRERNVKASLRIDGNLYGETAKTGREIQRFKLPAGPVLYAPQGMQASISRDFNVSAKAMFHVMFGDKSAVFQLLYSNRWGHAITQTPWTKLEGGLWTRQFTSQDHATPMADTQTVDIMNDHLCYVVTNDKHPWRFPYASSYTLQTRFVITHSVKSRCKLAIFQNLKWRQPPRLSYIRRLIEQQALNSLEADAIDLGTVANDQVAKLGSHSKTNRAIEIFGNIGQQKQAAQIDTTKVPNLGGTLKPGQVKPISLFRLVVNDALVQVLNLLGMVLDILIAVVKGLINACTAHTLLVALLAVSALYNGWYGYRDGLVWYHDRAASKFMARLGVAPNPLLAKGVYLSDIEELVTPRIDADALAALGPGTDDDGRRTCRSTFGEQLVSSTSVAALDPSTKRLHRTRDSLAKHRHDLLVALRVVNRVEKDVVLAEWEEWVRAEERKCQRVERLLQRRREGGRKGDRKGAAAAALSPQELDAELGPDFLEYCRSCRGEVAQLANGTSLM